MMYIAMIMCRSYGRENTSHLFLSQVPIMQTVAGGYSFDWDNILSDNLVREIIEYVTEIQEETCPIFHVILHRGRCMFYDTFSSDRLEQESNNC
jgi:hypothetical protein